MSKPAAKVKQEEKEVEPQEGVVPKVEEPVADPVASLDIQEAFLPSEPQPLVALEPPRVKEEDSEQPKKKRKLPKRGTPSGHYINQQPPKEEPDSYFDWSQWDSFRDYDV